MHEHTHTHTQHLFLHIHIDPCARVHTYNAHAHICTHNIHITHTHTRDVHVASMCMCTSLATAGAQWNAPHIQPLLFIQLPGEVFNYWLQHIIIFFIVPPYLIYIWGKSPSDHMCTSFYPPSFRPRLSWTVQRVGVVFVCQCCVHCTPQLHHDPTGPRESSPPPLPLPPVHVVCHESFPVFFFHIAMLLVSKWSSPMWIWTTFYVRPVSTHSEDHTTDSLDYFIKLFACCSWAKYTPW